MDEFESLPGDLLEQIFDGICLIDQNRKIVYWNKGAQRLTGRSSGDMVGLPYSDAFLPCIDSLIPRICISNGCLIETGARGEELRDGECYARHGDGSLIAVTVRIVTLTKSAAEPERSIIVFNDNSSIIEARREMENLRRITLLDPVTSTGTRRYAELSLQAKLDEMRRYSSSLGIMFIHVDNYQRIADKHGRDLSDGILKATARTLMNSLRSSDVVGRWEHRQFVAIVLHVDEETLLEVANRVRMLLQQSVLNENKIELRFTASIGATVATEEDTMDTLIERAMDLMEESRAAGGNCATVEGPAMKGTDSRISLSPLSK